MRSRLTLDLVLLAGLITSIAAASTDKSWLGAEFGVVQKVYEDCHDKDDFVGCLKEKALSAMSKAVNQDSVQIVDGLVLEKSNNTEKESIIGLTDARTMNSLSLVDRSLLEKFDKLLRTHVLRINMNEGREKGYGGIGGGGSKGGYKGGKKGGKGMAKYVIGAIAAAFGFTVPFVLKGIALAAIKAAIMSKVALTIAGIIALKKLFSQDHHDESSFQVHASEHNRRTGYALKPMKQSAASVDPYKYYYEYPTYAH